jgi:hypothetical protein
MPMFWTIFLVGIGTCTHTLVRWRGDPMQTLLLKSLEGGGASASENPSSEAPQHSPGGSPSRP